MIRYTDIPKVSPGEPISASLMNQIIGMAQNARFASGDGSVDVTQVGNTLGFSLGGTRPNSDKDVLVMAQGIQDKDQRAPRNETDKLIGGLYFGAIYYQPSVTFYETETPTGNTSLTPSPAPNLPSVSCYVVNLTELDGRSYPITAANVNSITNYGTNLILTNAMTRGRFAGTTSGGVPVVAVEVNVFKPVTAQITAVGTTSGQYIVSLLSSTPNIGSTNIVGSYGAVGTNRMAGVLAINLPEISATANAMSIGALVSGEMVGQTGQPAYTPVMYFSVGGSSGVSYGRITSVLSTTNATTWIYQVTFPGGGTASAYNGMEWNGTNSSMIQGSPGSLGVGVGTNGSVTGTSCFIKPIGVTGQVPFVFDSAASQWTFALPNSAGA